MNYQFHLSNMEMLELVFALPLFSLVFGFIIFYSPILTFGIEMFMMSYFMSEIGHLGMILYILRVYVVMFCLCYDK